MGNCCGTEEQKRTNRLNKDLKKKQQQEGKVKKLLLLGAGGSGKSTFFKQLRMLHGTPIGATEMENTYKDIVFSNVITGMKTLVENCRILSETVPKCKITEANQDFADFIENFEEDLFAEERLNVRQAIQQLWMDPGVQLTWRKHRSKFQVEDSAKHFFESIDRITESSYCPNDEDVLLARIRTTGIVEQELKIKGNVFQIFDVGGQRNERKKWIHCFENVTGVLFLVSLSAYDQTLYEDDTTNRMKEALGLFKNICNSRWFKDAAMILFLNKKDLFQEKISGVPINVCFPEYSGDPKDDVESRDYIKRKFQEQKKNDPKMNMKGNKNEGLFVHYTCAVDRDHVEKIFKSVRHVVIQKNLELAALI